MTNLRSQNKGLPACLVLLKAHLSTKHKALGAFPL